MHRAPLLAAATAKLTGALWRETLVPELSLPVSVPFATTPLVVARKLVICAVGESLDELPPAWICVRGRCEHRREGEC